jgi:hypothetical protein
MSAAFKKNIKALDFSFIEKNKNEESGVLLTDDFENKLDKKTTTPEVLFALETAKRFDADAVYFRYFNDGRGAVPQVYIYDNTSARLNEKRKVIHIKVWSGCQVPAYIIIDKTKATVFDARERAENDKENEAVKTIELVGTTIKDFSALDFDDGLFWEEEYNKKHFQYEKSVYRDLIIGLKKIYNDFQSNSGLDNHVALKLLVQCLLIKYLEEREEENVSGYFAKKYFHKTFGCENFCEVIRNGKLLELLDKLSTDFNGKIFEWDKEKETSARKKIESAKTKNLAEYLDGNIKDDSYVLWKLYSFSYLPVELISSVYEELLTNSEVASKDIVYTPEMIVSTLIDECMPLKAPQKDFKVIDVSCGSGIFLVKAYKRIIQWWRYEQWKKTGKLEKPSLDVLRKLLISSIYGVDINEDAIKLTVFSLALAMLDEVDLNPPLWQKLKFPVLIDETIKSQNFFEYISKNPPTDFDLVIGNPPFNLQLQNGKEPRKKEYFRNLERECGYKNQIKIPDENPALHFLTKSLTLLKPEAMLCLIQPSGPLLYQKDIEFKRAIFTKYNLLQVVDFTNLADVLWGKANVATAAIFIKNSEPDQEDVVHIVANKTFANINRVFLELDHYDFHSVSKDAVINSPFVWKANLLGGGRLLPLVERLMQTQTLGSYLKQKSKESNWVFGDGYIKGKPDQELVPEDFEKKKGGYLAAPYLTGSLAFDPEDFDEGGIKKTYLLEAKYFQWPRRPELFQAPLLLIKKNIGKKSIPIFLTEKSISFKNEIIGISAPCEDRPLLENIQNWISNNKTIRFYLSLTSSRSGISRSSSTLLQKDILNIPFSESTKSIGMSAVDNLLITDTLNYQLINGKQGLIKYGTVSQIKDFSLTLCRSLNSVYQIKDKSFRLFKIIDAGKYYAVHFEYTNKKYEPKLEATRTPEEYLQISVPTEPRKGKGLHIQKILKVYGKDRIILAKPKQLRYWLPSIALRDADEVFADYIKARYN